MVDAGLNDFLAEHPDYNALGVIGRGGMGTVYLAEQIRLQRRVAVKVLEGPFAEDPRARERFLREMRAVASIDHPGVLPIYDAGETRNALFTVMRFVDGPDLRQFLRENGAQPEDVVRRIGIQIGEALGAAHARGIVHRDVKPANVLLASTDLISAHSYLCDFGLAKRVDSGPSLTKMDEIVGTVDYIAPEQIEGGTVDARTDVYSLACVLYEMMLGKPPFEGHTEIAVLWSHLRDSPPVLRTSLPDVPSGLNSLLQSSMAKSPDERPSSAAEFVAALRSIDSAPAVIVAPRSTNASAETLLGERPPTEPGTSPSSGGDPEPSPQPQSEPTVATTEDANSASDSSRRRPSRKAKVLAGSGAAVVLVIALILGLTLGTGSKAPPTTSGTSGMTTKHTMSAMSIVDTPMGNGSLTKTDKALLSHADPQVAAQCAHFSDLGDWNGAVAGATCAPPHGASSVSYLQFSSKSAMDGHFEGLQIDAPPSLPPGNCAKAFNVTQNEEIRYPPAVSGSMICYLYTDGKPEMVWTNDKFDVLGWATGQINGAEGARTLLKWWEFQGGLCDPKCQDA